MYFYAQRLRVRLKSNRVLKLAVSFVTISFVLHNTPLSLTIIYNVNIVVFGLDYYVSSFTTRHST